MNFEAEKREKDRLTQAHTDLKKDLIKYTYFKVHNKSLSEDLVQETFLKTWKYVVKGGEIGMMKAFLYHILNGLIIDEYRKQKRQTYSLDTMTESGFDVPTDEHERLTESLDLKTAIHYIALLPEKYKEVVHMRLVMDMTLEEISNKLKKTRNSVAVMIHRGLKRMQLMHKKRANKMKLGERMEPSGI